ncbi:MAG: TonB-dependent receptor [Saprospiraceae bacterium]|nr:TonB-dependent receptor [Saprospiraceae bacterium]
MFQKLLFPTLLLLLAQALCAQTITLRGMVLDADNNRPVPDAAVVVSGTGQVAATDEKGAFVLEGLRPGKYTIVLSSNGYLPLEATANAVENDGPVLVFNLQHDPAIETLTTPIPVVTLDEAESDSEGGGEIANLLHSSRDVFQNASFGWSAYRFRERGYDSDQFPLYLNGIAINDPETGIAFFGEFGGLNDVLRLRETTIGLDACDFAFSEVGGATRLDTRASSQRKQIRASYAIANRNYTHRVMLTASTGLMPGGWAVTLSGSHRWAQEAYLQGTFFQGTSYFLSIDKKFGLKHTFNVTFLGAPSIQGRAGDTFQEMYDLAGSNYYNPNWGYQNGEKRNAVVRYSHQPIGILRYDWNPSRTTTLTATVYGQAGERGDSRLEFLGGTPSPDFNRNLPSAYEDPTQAAIQADLLRNSESLRQLDWTRFYEVNRNTPETVTDANGQAGNTITGNRAQFIVENQRGDSKETGFNAVLSEALGDRAKIQVGANYQWYRGQNFKTVDDLLGADYWLDIDRFAQRDRPGAANVQDNDVSIPNHVVRKDEVFGYNYDENIRNGGLWTQVQADFRKLAVFVSGEVKVNNFWRTGRLQNGRFPENSLGDSEKLSFNTYGTKGGLTYKLNGRNYLYANGFYGTRAPQFRDAFLSPRIRNEVVPGLQPNTTQSVEGGYILRAPRIRGRITGYLTQFKNETEASLFYLYSLGVFGTSILRGVDRQHAGIEAAFEVKASAAWTFSVAGNAGYYHYTSRPLLYVTQDNTSELIVNGATVYQENYLVPRTPQTTGMLGIRYEGRRFWFASLTATFADNLWYDFDRTRRTAAYVESLVKDSEPWNRALDQQKAPAAFSLDFFGGKSWKFSKYFLYLNVGVNNLLNNQNIIISGRDSYRNSYANAAEDDRFYTNELT